MQVAVGHNFYKTFYGDAVVGRWIKSVFQKKVIL